MNTNREIPDYIDVAEDGSTVTVTLSRPVDIDGQKRETITLREPTVGEQKRFRTSANAPAKVIADNEERFLLSLADGVTPAALESLPMRDGARLNEGFGFFFD